METLIKASKARNISEYNSDNIYKIINEKILSAARKGLHSVVVKGNIPANIENALISLDYAIVQTKGKTYIRW